jgi:membrane-bound serine protease (ClpP class)
VKSILLVAVAALCLVSVQALASEVHVVAFEGAIGPAASGFFGHAIERAENASAVCLVIEMDTPGGLDTSMREIIRRILGSRVPVVIYVYPSGARCASAGVFISMAADAVGMAPGTSIGAAHPVTIGGGEVDEHTLDKIVNDSASYIKSLAAKHGRNEEWAEQAVRSSATATAEEALELGVIDAVAADLTELLDMLDGLKIGETKGGFLETRGAEVRRYEMGLRYRLLGILSNPNIAYLLLILGFYGLFFELSNPGSVFPGVLGAIFLVLAFYSFQMLPINYAGVLLIILAVAFFIAEIFVTSGGLLAVGGGVAMFFGSLMLIRSPAPFLQISYKVILPAVVATAAFFVFAVGAGIRAQFRKPTTGSEGIVGKRGTATSDIDRTGQAFIHGELWTVTSNEKIVKGDEVEVISIRGLTPLVRRVGSEEESSRRV